MKRFKRYNTKTVRYSLLACEADGGEVDVRTVFNQNCRNSKLTGEGQYVAQFTAKMQKAFAHYAEHRNKSEAYRHAYNCENMKAETVRVRAWDLFNHPLMAAAVSQMQATAAVKVEIDAAWVLKRAALLADFNIRKFLKEVDLSLIHI